MEGLAAKLWGQRQAVSGGAFGIYNNLYYNPPKNPGCKLPDCDRMVVTEAVHGEGPASESTTALRGATGIVYNLNSTLLVTATTIAERLGLSDVVNNNLTNSWSRVPDELRGLWPEFNGLWDDPDSHWLYFKYFDPERAPRDSVCAPFDGLLPADHTRRPVYVVSGMMPYAVYDFRGIETVVTCTGPKVKMRIRYWAGFIHHFSFFVTDKTAESYTMADLPPEVSDLSSSETEFQGTRVKWWVGYTGGVRATLLWGNPLQGAVQRRYRCNIEETTPQYPDGYEKSSNDTNASDLCFSDRNAGPKDMTSLLAESATGEVCFVVEPDEAWDYEGLVKEGFERLFGGMVTSQLRLEYLISSSIPYTVERTVSINARSLSTVSDLYRRVNNLRQTDAGKWLYRSHDVNLLLDIATQEEQETKKCCS